MNKVITTTMILVIILSITIPTIHVVYAKKHKVESTSTQSPDRKRLISDDPAGSPGDVGGQVGYKSGLKGGPSEPEGHHSPEYTQQYKEFNKIAKEDQQLKKNGQLSQDYLNAMGDK
jgi:hypothetical protein